MGLANGRWWCVWDTCYRSLGRGNRTAGPTEHSRSSRWLSMAVQVPPPNIPQRWGPTLPSPLPWLLDGGVVGTQNVDRDGDMG